MTDARFPTADQASGNDPNEPAVDSKARREDREFFPTQEEQNLEAYRALRKHAFYALGIICLAYLCVLLFVLVCVFSEHGSIAQAILSNNPAPNWHPLVLMGVALVIFATVPLTLAMGLLHMASEGRSGSSEKSGVKIPSAEALKIALDAVLKATGKA